MPTERNDAQFGEPISGSRWFTGEMRILRKRKIPVIVRWLCPYPDCEGEMQPNGTIWPTGDPGIHHTCAVCGFTAAVHDRFPKVEYEDTPDGE